MALRVAAVGDIHYGKDSRGALRELLAAASRAADVLLLCGDLTHYGLSEEAEVLASDLRCHVHIPVLAVLGNHDFESDQPEGVRAALEAAGVRVLDGETAEVGGVGFAGTAGFGGGFRECALNAWGEPLIKQFVQEAKIEQQKLEEALRRVSPRPAVALLHYSPIRDTVEGEKPEIFPFLGSSHLEGPLDRHGVRAAFHGHAHAGSARGFTTRGVPVYNVSLPLLRRQSPEGMGLCVVTVE